MEPIFRQNFTVETIHLDRFGRVKPSVLLYIVQEVAGGHCQQLSLTWEDMAQKGLFWAVIRHRLQITRMPVAGDVLTVETWPMPTTRAAFPRAVAAYDAQGNEVFRCVSLWVLMDQNTRAMVLPEKSGVALSGLLRGCELATPGTIIPRQGNGYVICDYKTQEEAKKAKENYEDEGIIAEYDYILDTKDQNTTKRVADICDKVTELSKNSDKKIKVAVIDTKATAVADEKGYDFSVEDIITKEDKKSDKESDKESEEETTATLICKDVLINSDYNAQVIPIDAADENGMTTSVAIAKAIQEAKEMGADIVSVPSSENTLTSSALLTNISGDLAYNEAETNGMSGEISFGDVIANEDFYGEQLKTHTLVIHGVPRRDTVNDTLYWDFGVHWVEDRNASNVKSQLKDPVTGKSFTASWSSCNGAADACGNKCPVDSSGCGTDFGKLTIQWNQISVSKWTPYLELDCYSKDYAITGLKATKTVNPSVSNWHGAEVHNEEDVMTMTSKAVLISNHVFSFLPNEIVDEDSPEGALGFSIYGGAGFSPSQMKITWEAKTVKPQHHRVKINLRYQTADDHTSFVNEQKWINAKLAKGTTRTWTRYGTDNSHRLWKSASKTVTVGDNDLSFTGDASVPIYRQHYSMSVSKTPGISAVSVNSAASADVRWGQTVNLACTVDTGYHFTGWTSQYGLINQSTGNYETDDNGNAYTWSSLETTVSTFAPAANNTFIANAAENHYVVRLIPTTPANALETTQLVTTSYDGWSWDGTAFVKEVSYNQAFILPPISALYKLGGWSAVYPVSGTERWSTLSDSKPESGIDAGTSLSRLSATDGATYNLYTTWTADESQNDIKLTTTDANGAWYEANQTQAVIVPNWQKDDFILTADAYCPSTGVKNVAIYSGDRVAYNEAATPVANLATDYTVSREGTTSYTAEMHPNVGRPLNTQSLTVKIDKTAPHVDHFTVSEGHLGAGLPGQSGEMSYGSEVRVKVSDKNSQAAGGENDVSGISSAKLIVKGSNGATAEKEYPITTFDAEQRIDINLVRDFYKCMTIEYYVEMTDNAGNTYSARQDVINRDIYINTEIKRTTTLGNAETLADNQFRGGYKGVLTIMTGGWVDSVDLKWPQDIIDARAIDEERTQPVMDYDISIDMNPDTNPKVETNANGYVRTIKISFWIPFYIGEINGADTDEDAVSYTVDCTAKRSGFGDKVSSPVFIVGGKNVFHDFRAVILQ